MGLVITGGAPDGSDLVVTTPACGYWDCECCPKDGKDCSKCPCKISPCKTCAKRCNDCARAEAKRRYEKAQQEAKEQNKRWAEEHAKDGKETFSERIKDYRQSTNIEDRRNWTFDQVDKDMNFPGWGTNGQRMNNWSDMNDWGDSLDAYMKRLGK